MGYMKSLDLSERFSKLTDAQKNAVINIMSGGTEKVHPSTYKALQSRELIVKNGDGWELEAYFKAELMNAIEVPEPREVKAEDLTEHEIMEMLVGESGDVSEDTDAPVIPYFNRAAKREMRRNIARLGRATMRNHGKRIKKYGVLLDPKYVARKLSA